MRMPTEMGTLIIVINLEQRSYVNIQHFAGVEKRNSTLRTIEFNLETVLNSTPKRN
jgi:hypothetical protein